VGVPLGQRSGRIVGSSRNSGLHFRLAGDEMGCIDLEVFPLPVVQETKFERESAREGRVLKDRVVESVDGLETKDAVDRNIDVKDVSGSKNGLSDAGELDEEDLWASFEYE